MHIANDLFANHRLTTTRIALDALFDINVEKLYSNDGIVLSGDFTDALLMEWVQVRVIHDDVQTGLQCRLNHGITHGDDDLLSVLAPDRCVAHGAQVVLVDSHDVRVVLDLLLGPSGFPTGWQSFEDDDTCSTHVSEAIKFVQPLSS